MSTAQPVKGGQFNIKITHLPTSEQVEFLGWVNSFSDNFSSQWNETPVYGRMDPLATFERTTRKISVSFTVVAGSANEAYMNDLSVNRLIQFLYPVYDQNKQANRGGLGGRDESILAAAPLLKVRFANLIQNNVSQDGLVCYLEGIDYAPNLDAGQFFAGKPSSGGPYIGNMQPANTMYYQEMNINLALTVLHSHLTGWVKGSDNTFYFGADPQVRGASAYLGNFPHGGTNVFMSKGREPAKVFEDQSSVNSNDPASDTGANTDVAAANVGTIEGQ